MNTQKINFWQEKYTSNNIGWDIGSISTPLKEYFDQLKDKNIKILIPGAGNAYEAEYLHKLGFKNVHVIDWAKTALDGLAKRVADFPKKHLHQVDFFEHEGNYDLIIEQTFFCAISVNLRKQYVSKMKSLLKPNGKLVGLLFNKALNTEHPPFGGSKAEYTNLFNESFDIKTMENATNSIEPRKGSELFIKLIVK